MDQFQLQTQNGGELFSKTMKNDKIGPSIRKNKLNKNLPKQINNKIVQIREKIISLLKTSLN